MDLYGSQILYYIDLYCYQNKIKHNKNVLFVIIPRYVLNWFYSLQRFIFRYEDLDISIFGFKLVPIIIILRF